MERFSPAYDQQISDSLPMIIERSSSKSLNHLSPALQHILKEVQRELGILEAETKEQASEDFIKKIVSTTGERFGFELTSYEIDTLISFLDKDRRPFGILQELVDDPEVSDIIVAGYNSVTVQLGRATCSSDITFHSQEFYEAFVERLLNICGSTYSTKKPIADGMIGSEARIHVVHKSIADNGPYLTIRINRFSRVFLSDLEGNGLAPQPIISYLSAVLAYGNTILIAGEVGTGKTTLTRALATTFPQGESLLVIEDTPEIKLEHPNVRYMRTREANSEGAGLVTASDCIRGGMRMAMNRIIFGEIRDALAAEAFIDVCASGHPGLSTIHARSGLDALSRLSLFLGRVQKGVAENVLLKQIASAVQVVVHVGICPHTKKRRILEVIEPGSVADGNLQHRQIFRYECLNNSPQWKVVNKISRYRLSVENPDERLELQKLPSVLDLGSKVGLKEAQQYGEANG